MDVLLGGGLHMQFSGLRAEVGGLRTQFNGVRTEVDGLRETQLEHGQILREHGRDHLSSADGHPVVGRACPIWVLDYGVPGLFPLTGVAMIVMAVRNRPGAGQRLLPQRSHLPQVVFVVVIVPAQVWPAEGTDYWGYCVAITVCLAAVAHAVTTVRVLAARRRA